MEWLRNLNNAINYIEENLEGTISYDEAARIACCSTSYFQRMFAYVAGLSLSEYIRCRKMTQAAFELQSGELKVLDIGLKYGYMSPTAFNRAFKSVHGISPIVARRTGVKLNSYLPLKLTVQVLGGENMPYQLEKKESIRVVGMRIPLSDDMEKNQKIVPEFWKEVLQGDSIKELCKLENKGLEGILGVTAYINPQEIYYYIGVATEMEIPESMYELKIPATDWVVFKCNGPYKESVQNIFKRFLTEWLPFSGYQYAELPDLEVYPKYEKDQLSGCCEVWIAVRKDNNDEISSRN